MCSKRRLRTHYVPERPRIHTRGTAASSPQQELAKPVPRPQLILLGSLSGSYQIPQRFVLRIRYPHRR